MCSVEAESKNKKQKYLTISGKLIFSHSSSPLHFHELVANLFLLCLQGLHNLHLAHTMFLHRLQEYRGNMDNVNQKG